MKNFLYKLVFPVSGKLYFGRAANESRYKGNKPNQQFVGPHHNPEVQNLLDQGEFCFFLVVKEFETSEQVETAEGIYLKKVWKTNDWSSRPRWLMNRNRDSVGGGGLLNITEEQFQKFQQAGAKSKGGKNNKGNKRPDAAKRMKGNTLGSATKGRARPDVSERLKGNKFGEKNKGRKSPWTTERNKKKVTCEHCGKEIGNIGALGTHKKKCSRRES